MPKKFTVGIYTPDNANMYHIQLMLDVARAQRDIDFYCFGNSLEPKPIAPNVKFVGWQEPEEIVKNCSVLLRLAIHDGFPVLASEFIMAGRPVITNTLMPEIDQISIPPQLEKSKMAEYKQIVAKGIRRYKDKIPSLKSRKKLAKQYADLLDPENFKRSFNHLKRAVIAQNEKAQGIVRNPRKKRRTLPH